MLNATPVAVFAARLSQPVDEDGWRDEWSHNVAEEMRNTAPVDTGALRASIHTTNEGVTVGVRYGVYVEFGTSDTAPQPFAGPAINRLIRPSAEDLGDRIIDQLT